MTVDPSRRRVLRPRLQRWWMRFVYGNQGYGPTRWDEDDPEVLLYDRSKMSWLLPEEREQFRREERR